MNQRRAGEVPEACSDTADTSTPKTSRKRPPPRLSAEQRPRNRQIKTLQTFSRPLEMGWLMLFQLKIVISTRKVKNSLKMKLHSVLTRETRDAAHAAMFKQHSEAAQMTHSVSKRLVKLLVHLVMHLISSAHLVTLTVNVLLALMDIHLLMVDV